jgi:hypothetical protein
MNAAPRKWSCRSRRFLVSTPGLIAPVAVLALGIQWLIRASAEYFSLPPVARLAGGGPFSADAGMFAPGVVVVFGLLLFLPPLLVGLSGRLRWWTGVAAVGLQLIPLWVAWDFAKVGSIYGWLVLLLLTYVPVLLVVMLVLQARSDSPPDSSYPTSGHRARCT